MQIILLEKVTNLGALGDIVKVRDGFARNYLIPQGKAKRATRENLAEFEQRRAELEKAQNEQLTTAQEKAEKLEGLAVQIAQKAGFVRLYEIFPTEDQALVTTAILLP